MFIFASVFGIIMTKTNVRCGNRNKGNKLMQQAIILDDINKKETLADLQKFLDEQSPDSVIAGKSEDEIMDMVNEIIEESRAAQTQKI